MTVRSGRVWKFGDNVSGDHGIIEFSVIVDFTKPFDEAALARMCMRKIDPEFPDKVRPGDIVVGGRNFAHHSHPQVAVALKAAGLGAVVVESTETGFLRKCVNIGFPLVLCPGITAAVETGHELRVDLAAGEVANRTTGQVLRTKPYAPRLLAMIDAGGLIPHLRHEFANSAWSRSG